MRFMRIQMRHDSEEAQQRRAARKEERVQKRKDRKRSRYDWRIRHSDGLAVLTFFSIIFLIIAAIAIPLLYVFTRCGTNIAEVAENHGVESDYYLVTFDLQDDYSNTGPNNVLVLQDMETGEEYFIHTYQGRIFPLNTDDVDKLGTVKILWSGDRTYINPDEDMERFLSLGRYFYFYMPSNGLIDQIKGGNHGQGTE